MGQIVPETSQVHINNENIGGFINKKIQINEETISYCVQEKEDAQVTLLFIHGAFINKETMKPLATEFSGSQSILIDLPGHGASTGTAKSSVYEYAKTIKLFISELEKNHQISKDIILIGWSMGGSISLELALQNIPQIKKIILVSSSPNWVFPQIPKEAFDLNMIFSSVFTKRTPEEAKERILNNLSNYASSLDTCMIDINTLNAFDIVDKLKDISMPVLIISGDVDSVALIDKQYVMQQAFEHSEIEILNDRGHCLILESPDQLAVIIKTFLK